MFFMDNKKFKPLFDKSFYILLVFVAALLIAMTMLAITYPKGLFIFIPIDLFCLYFFVSPCFGYVQLREDSLFIKFGFFIKRDIPYKKIRTVKKDRKFYSDSMLALKNSLEHINIKYNSFDVVAVSVVNNDEFISELNERCKAAERAEK